MFIYYLHSDYNAFCATILPKYWPKQRSITSIPLCEHKPRKNTTMAYVIVHITSSASSLSRLSLIIRPCTLLCNTLTTKLESAVCVK